jgi:hypothetical protein
VIGDSEHPIDPRLAGASHPCGFARRHYTTCLGPGRLTVASHHRPAREEAESRESLRGNHTRKVEMTIPLPPQVRAALYWINTGLVVILAAVLLWFQVTQGERPVWADGAAEALLAVGTVFGFTAATNTQGAAIDPTALPPSVRKVLYYIAGAVQLATLLLSIYFRITPGAEPLVLDFVNQLLLLISGILSGVAASHVVPNPPPADEAQPEIG